MPRRYRQDEVINGYTIKRDAFHNSGAMAVSYAAIDQKGNSVFLKMYKSPSIRVGWYREYVDYQKELHRRIHADPVLNECCCSVVDFFEEKRCYHQVYPWMGDNDELSKVLEQVKAGSGPDFAQRLMLAKCLMHCVATMHASNIIHADFNTENVQIAGDISISTGQNQLVFIGMDFSVLSDRCAPWHDDLGYIGTPNYYSPEHLRGEAPNKASDVFTCALILHELLGAGHPYESWEVDEYVDKVSLYRASKPWLKGEIIDAVATDLVADYLHACLNPDPAKRPTAKDVQDALDGKSPPIEIDTTANRMSPNPAPETKPTTDPAIPKIFISYRREDSDSAANHLHEKLRGHFGSENVFFDVDTIPIGRNFVEYLDEQVSQCDVLLAVIGKRWLEAIDENGDFRLQNENDFVRIEITSALNRGRITVVPVLVEGAKIPPRDALPLKMNELSVLNAAQVRTGPDFQRDVDNLIRALESME